MKTRSASACPDQPLQLNDDEHDRMLDNRIEPPTNDCSIELYFGCFFDGTRNNLYVSEKKGDGSESNIARLFKAYDILPKPDYSSRIHRFSSYIQGVGTDARPKMHDAGIGAQAQAGAAAGWGGEGRINWMLLQFQDHLHEHFHGLQSTLTKAMGREEAAEVRRMSADMRMGSMQLQKLADNANKSLAAYLQAQGSDEVALRAAQGAIDSVMKVHKTHSAKADDSARYQLLQERRSQLQQRLKNFLPLNPKVKRIRLSVFGFSRGAAEARVFSNWLVDACDPEEKELKLCGIAVQFDFLGLFDTVVSSGIAQSAFERIYSGHGAWGRYEDLSIPSYVKRCVHMVAAHEVRGSFPLDLVEGTQCEEIVYPGVHSDVGGGYLPGEQGRSPEPGDKLAQIPLCAMYREALASGVPMMEDFSTAVGTELAKQFAVSKRLRLAFNAYLDAMQPLCKSLNRTYPLMLGHYQQFLHWRRQRLQDFAATASVKKASAQDRADLIAANEELKQELIGMEKNNATQRLQQSGATPLSRMNSILLAAVLPTHYIAGTMKDIGQAVIRGKKEEQWLKHFAQIWNSQETASDAVAHLLEHYVHDSRAWFKPLGDDDDVWKHKHQVRMRALETHDAQHQQFIARFKKSNFIHGDGTLVPQPLSPSDRVTLDAWRRTATVPPQTSGREPYGIWGYLRWRTAYQGQNGRNVAQRRALMQQRSSAHLAEEEKRLAEQEKARLLAQEYAPTMGESIPQMWSIMR